MLGNIKKYMTLWRSEVTEILSCYPPRLSGVGGIHKIAHTELSKNIKPLWGQSVQSGFCHGFCLGKVSKKNGSIYSSIVGVRFWLHIRAQNIFKKLWHSGCESLYFSSLSLNSTKIRAVLGEDICTCLLAFRVKVQKKILFCVPFIVWRVFLYFASRQL